MFEKLKSALGFPTVDYNELIANGAVLIDVRTPQEYNSGHSRKSKNIPLNDIQKKAKSLKGKEVIVVCASGMRSGQAKSILSQEGITVHNGGSWTRFKNL